MESRIGLIFLVIAFVIILTSVLVRLMGLRLVKIDLSLSFLGMRVMMDCR